MIDSHSHIYGPRFQDDQKEVIERAIDAGVTQLLQVGCNLEESRAVVALAEAYQGIYASVGVHPHDASTVTPDVIKALESLVDHPKVLSWGEIGLDFYYDSSPREIQKTAFDSQMEAATRLGMPVVIHTRDAEPETLEILCKRDNLAGGHVHCFTGTKEMAMDLLDLGYHIGFTGIITFKNAAALREVVAAVPLERLLIETDSPYLAPVPKRGKRNEPSFVQYVADAVAEIKEISRDDVIAATTENFYRVYGLCQPNWQPLAV